MASKNDNLIKSLEPFFVRRGEVHHSTIGQYSLDADVSAGGTSLNVTGIDLGAINNGIWVIIDPWTVQCEIRQVSVIAGHIVTVSALTYSHSKGDAVIFTTNTVAYAEWFGALADGSTNNREAFQAGTLECQKQHFVFQMNEGNYYIEFTAGDAQIDITTDDLVMRGMGRNITTVTIGPNSGYASAFTIWSFNIQGVNFEATDFLIVPPTKTDIASCPFNSLPHHVAFYIEPDDIDITVSFRRVNSTQGFEDTVQLSGNGSNGFLVDIDDCVMYGYSVTVALASSDDQYTSTAVRAIHVRHSELWGHNNEGPDWATRGHCLYPHPHLSVLIDDVQFYNSGRDCFVHYSVSGVEHTAIPDSYMICTHSKFRKLNAALGGGGIFTSNTSKSILIEYCDFDVNDYGITCRYDSTIDHCNFHGKGGVQAYSSEIVATTYLAVALSGGETTATVGDGSLFTSGDLIYIVRDDRTLFNTTISGAPVGNVVTLAAAYSGGAASVNNLVEQYDSSLEYFGYAKHIRISNSYFNCDDSAAYPAIRVALRGVVDVDNCDINITIGAGVDSQYGGTINVNHSRIFARDYPATGRAANITNGRLTLHHVTFAGDFTAGLIRLFGSSVTCEMWDCDSYANDQFSSFFIATAQPTLSVIGGNNKFYGTAVPLLTTAQSLDLPRAQYPTTIASASQVNISWNYDTYRIDGSSTINNIYVNGNTTQHKNHQGIIKLIVDTGASWALSAAGNIAPKHTAARTPTEVILLYHDSVAGKWYETGWG